MTDYSEIPNAFINSQVAQSQGHKLWPHTVFMPITDERVRLEDGSYFDPCNNPSDAWPIILSSLIALKPVKLYVGGHRWFASKGDGDFGLKFADDNPLRAAMIVYLMMKESENADI